MYHERKITTDLDKSRNDKKEKKLHKLPASEKFTLLSIAEPSQENFPKGVP